MWNNKNKAWYLFILLGLILFMPSLAHADCSNPAGVESEIVYNTSFLTMQYCDGTNWIVMHQPGSGSGGCSSPAGIESEIVYNTSFSVMQACAGNQWMAMGPLGGVPPEGDFASVSAGAFFSCGLKNDGTAWCWGFGEKTGSGTSDDQPTPVQIAETGPWSMVRAGGYDGRGCAVKTDGTAWCWGPNGNGTLGIGVTGGTYDTPQQVSDAGPWSQVNGLTHFTCGIKTDDTLWCWGSNSNGQLGIGVTGGDYNTPQQITESGPWASFAKGGGDGNQTCAVKSDGTAWCWGGGTGGQLGNGENVNYASAQQLSEAGPWDMVSVGRDYSCGLKSDGTAWCWGSDSAGKLGNGAGGGSNVPVQVADAGPWSMITSGPHHSCAIKTADGSAWCWGEGENGRLGNGSSADQPSPVQVTDPGPWAEIDAGYDHTCGMKTDGSVYCWGENGYGQLGIAANNLVPMQIYEPGPWDEIHASRDGSCGIKTDGTAWCWGNAGADIGNSSASGTQYAPVQISESGPWDILSAGQNHVCGVKNDSSLWCWGGGTYGQLGNENTSSQSDPVQIAEAGPWDFVGLGMWHSCGIKSDGSAWCWGQGSSGKLGNGESVNYSSAQQVSEAGPWDMVSGGYSWTCGVKTDGTAWCWGDDSSGKLGCGGCGNQNSPVQISEAGPWDTVSTGNGQSCGIKTDGTAWCWGSNSNGKLGIGVSGGNYNTPQQISEPGPWAMIRANWEYTCAVKTDGSGWCWGQGDTGELGNDDTASYSDPVQVSGTGSWSMIGHGLDNQHTCGVKTDGTGWCWGLMDAGRLGIGDNGSNQVAPAGVGANCGLGAEAISEGQITYNTDVNAIQYCAGAGLVKVGK